jgi:hypothetical protein
MTKDEGYHFLSDLVFKGFLCMEAELSGQVFIFKTVNDKEYDLIKLYAGDPKSPYYSFKFNMSFLVFSILLMNGQNILETREANYKDLFDLFSQMPHHLYKKILNELMVMRRIAIDADQFIEGFSYTDFSRRIWGSIGNNSPNNENFTGIPGTGKIGLNSCQENWISINRMLDDEEDFNKDFSLAIMISSAMNHKGARLTRSRHDAEMQTNKEKRKKLAREGSARKTINWSEQGWAVPVDTAEELVAELERQMQGVKDRHDLFIDEYMKKMQEMAEKKILDEDKKLEESRKRHEGMAPISGSQRALTTEENQELMARKKSNNLVIVPSDNRVSNEDELRYLKKIGSKVLTAKR